MIDNTFFLKQVENDLKKCCDEYFLPDSAVADAARYSLLNAGKRTRAILIFLTAQMCSKDLNSCLRLASAVEMVHCYSLIHDDLPCMDNDDLRRGKPSCHKAHGENIALLAGDALLGCALQAVANIDNMSDKSKIAAIKEFTEAIGPKGMIYGQELDLTYEDKIADKKILSLIHKNKTGRLISLCGFLGSLDAELTAKQRAAIALFFDNVGLVFQIVDDILDVEGDTENLGKPVGSDSENNKSTFVTLYGLAQAKEIAKELTEQADNSLGEAFGEKAVILTEYTQYLLNRKK
ncbi:MAG: polyprenyl synthetase family protein [Oscillospiraceae bacterium]